MTAERKPKPPSVLSISFPNRQALADSHMPFLKNGGVFIPTDKEYEIGDKVIVMVTTLDGLKMPATGTVAWMNPGPDSGNRFPIGIGVHLDGDEKCRALAARMNTDSAGVKVDNGRTL